MHFNQEQVCFRDDLLRGVYSDLGHWGLNIEGFWQVVNSLTSTLSFSVVVLLSAKRENR